MINNLNNKVYGKDYFGYVYIWYDIKRKKFLIGSHHGPCNMKYKTSTGGAHVKRIFKNRPHTMKFKILDINTTTNCYKTTRMLEQKWLNLRPNINKTPRYYNISQNAFGIDSARSSKIQQQRVKEGTHTFLHGTIQRRLLDEGNHYFQSSLHRQKTSLRNKLLAQQNLHPAQKLANTGKHHWIGGKMQHNKNIQLVKEGKHLFQSESHRKKLSFLAKQKILNKTHVFCTPNFNGKPFKITCSNGKCWQYSSKAQAMKDGFLAYIIDKLRKNNMWVVRRHTGRAKKYCFAPGDILYYTGLDKNIL